MAQRELTLHPETGALVEVVHSYQGVEVPQLQDDVNNKEQTLTDVQTRKQAIQDQLNAVIEEETKAQADLDDSKSTLERGQQLVGAPAGGVDAGADGASGEVPAEGAGENF